MKTLLLTLMMITTADQPRQVILFYTENGKSLFEKQSEEFQANDAGMRERDINVIPYQLSKENAAQWKRYKVDTSKDFTFILIGRDGGEKHRADRVVPAKELFGKIDAMPMRKNEVREKN